MSAVSQLVAQGEGARAGTVGWIVLIVAIVIGIIIFIIFAVNGTESLLDRLGPRMPAFSLPWFVVVAVGLGLLGLSYIVASLGIAILGVVVLILAMVISDHSHG